MTIRPRWIECVLAALYAAAAGCHNLPAQDVADTIGKNPTQSRVALSHALPRFDADHLEATVVEVTYPPGGSSAPHSHPCPVIGYVLSEALRTQVKGEPEAIYTAGQSFYEPPNAVHLVSANASHERPATFLAYFTCDHQTPLSVPLRKTQR